jgi:hypothetical protein
VIGGWRTFHNEELQNLYCLPIIIGTIKWWHVACMGEDKCKQSFGSRT